MHPVLGKIQFKSFEGLYDINGTSREVAFVDKDGDGPSVLAIRGLSVEDAIHILHQLSGVLLKGKDAEQPAKEQLALPHTNGVKKDAAKVETKPEPKKETKPAPKVEAKPEPEPEHLAKAKKSRASGV